MFLPFQATELWYWRGKMAPARTEADVISGIFRHLPPVDRIFQIVIGKVYFDVLNVPHLPIVQFELLEYPMETYPWSICLRSTLADQFAIKFTKSTTSSKPGTLCCNSNC
jgi:hypothetical protein